MKQPPKEGSAMSIRNKRVSDHDFLADLAHDDCYEDIFEEGVRVLKALCEQIELVRPSDIEELYELTQAAASELNELMERNIDIDTVARECLAEEFEFVAQAYGFQDADSEELIATRDW
jgi:hypothetical protein